MRVLYLKPATNQEPIPDLLIGRKHEVFPVAAPSEALRLTSARPFDAVVIDDELGDPETLSFVVEVHRTQSELPVFLLSVWGPELLEVLESLARFREAGEAQLLTA